MPDRMKVTNVDIRLVLDASPDAKTSTVLFQGVPPVTGDGEGTPMASSQVPSLTYPVTAQAAANYRPGDLYDMELIKVQA